MKSLKNKKGISTIIASILMIVIVLVATGVIYGVASNLIFDNTQKAEKCGSDIIDKITINGAYTCHNRGVDPVIANPYALIQGETSISINVKDVTIEKIFIVISKAGESKTLELVGGIPNPNVKNLGAGYNVNIILPGKNSGKTYIIKPGTITIANTEVPDSIAVIPVIGGEQCGTSDQLNEIPTCAELFG